MNTKIDYLVHTCYIIPNTFCSKFKKIKRRYHQPCIEAHTDSALIVEKCDDKNKKGERARAGENVVATAADST